MDCQMNNSKKKVKIDRLVFNQVHGPLKPEGQVTIHCYFRDMDKDTALCISRKTFITAHNSFWKRKLSHADNIPVFPEIRKVSKGQFAVFTLYFPPIPGHIKAFSFGEVHPELGGIRYSGIQRNEKDVYHVVI
jgi:hypothetical protein